MDELRKLLNYLDIQSPQAREIMRESAVVRWRWFQNTYPDLQNVMQLKNVASFLGMTPVTLSRIRAKEAEDETMD